MEYLVIIRYRLTDNNVPACYHTSTGFQMEESAASIGVEELEEILVLDETRPCQCPQFGEVGTTRTSSAWLAEDVANVLSL